MGESVFQGPDDVRYRLEAMSFEVFIHTLSHLLCNGRVEEVGRTYLYGRGSCQQEFYGIGSVADTTQTDDGDTDGLSHLVHHAQGHRLDGRTAESSRTDAEQLATLLGIDGHAKNFSIRLLPEGRFHLAPLYDVISMWPYAGHGAGKASLHKLKMAMAVVGESGKHYVWSKIQRRHFEHMGKMVGIADPAGIIDQVVARTPGVVRGVLAQLPADFPEAISQAILSGLVESALKLGRAPSST